MTPATLLFRQVNPSWVRNGRITSQVFKPTPKDKGYLSTYNGDQITAEASWRHYTIELEYQSVGIVAVTVCECKKHDLGVKRDPDPFPEHVVIKFKGYSRSQIEKKAKHLKEAAEMRGWQYKVDE